MGRIKLEDKLGKYDKLATNEQNHKISYKFLEDILDVYTCEHDAEILKENYRNREIETYYSLSSTALIYLAGTLKTLNRKIEKLKEEFSTKNYQVVKLPKDRLVKKDEDDESYIFYYNKGE